jgi:two-component system, OmpR family, alkaline phosphatase synthesis response regulator PhoP
MEKHVLVVDDEAHIRRIVEINLKRAGYRVTMAVDGVEALEKVKAERPDLVLLDVMMPRMDGFEALRILKEDAETAEIPVMMLTARAQDQDIFQGTRGGAIVYLTKPFSPQDLLTGVKQALDS